MTAAERVSCKESDFLDNDPPLRGQNYVCLSFLSPEDAIIKKDVFCLNQYMGTFAKDVGDLFDNLSKKFENDQSIVDMFKVLRDRYDYVFDAAKLQEAFALYNAENSERLDAEYMEKNNFQTSVRGIKVRGTYETLVEAQRRAEQLKKLDGKFDIYVAEVGCWCPWAPNPLEITDQEYAETELNTLMKKYKENIEEKDVFYQQRAEEMKKKAKAHKQPDDSAEASTSSTPDVAQGESADPWIERKENDASGSSE